jgi:hypothetical protein
MEWREWGIAPPFLALALDGGELISFKPLSPYPWYPLDKRLGGPESQSVHSGEENNLALAGNGIPAI